MKFSTVLQKSILIFLLSLTIQYVFLTFNPLTELKNDALTYDIIASNIMTGHGFSRDGITPTTLYPLFPFFLAGIYATFGHTIFLAQILLAGFLAITCVIIFAIGRLVFNERVGFLTAIFLACYPPFIALSRIMYAEPLFIVFQYISILLIILFFIQPRLLLLFLCGVSLGLANLAKPYTLYIPLITAIFFFYAYTLKKALGYCVVICLGFCLAMLPWIIHNYKVYGEFRPVSFFAIKHGKIVKVDMAATYDKNLAKTNLEKFQKKVLKKNYGITESDDSVKPTNNIIVTFTRHFGSDATGDPKNAFELIRMMFITSYGDVLDMGIPFKTFAEQPHLQKKYKYFLFIKILLIFASLLISILGMLGTLMHFLKKSPAAFLAWIFWAYTIFFIIWTFSYKQVGICGRYGLPVVPLLTLFAFDICINRFFSHTKRKL